MSSGIFNTLVPSTTSGNQLATILTDFKNAVVSGFSGTTRPSALVAGGYWIDTTNDLTGYWDFRIYDGVQDVTIFTLNKSTGTASIGSADALFKIEKTSPDSVGSAVRLLKKRLTNNGQILSGDTIGEIQFYGYSDAGVASVQAGVRSISTNNVTSSARGAYLVFEATSESTTTLVEIMRMVDGKVGIGTTAPEHTLHVKGSGVQLEKASSDSVGPELIVRKKRLSTAVLNGDSIGRVEFKSTDELAAAIPSFAVEVSANEAHSSTAHGTKIVIRNKKKTQTTYTDQITIEDDVTIPVLNSTTINVTNLIATNTTLGTVTEVVDPSIVLNKGGTQAVANAAVAGFEVQMTDSTYFKLGYDSSKASKVVAGLVGALKELVNVDATQTLTNKTLTSPAINTPTGLVKGDVGLGLVDNTSDATKNSAAVTLTNKTLTSPVINAPTGLVKGDVGLGAVDNTSDTTKNAATATLTNKTLTSPVINSPSGLIKGDVGLGLVDNTSDATKNSAAVTLTNKTLTSPVINSPSVVTPTRLDVKQGTESSLVTYALTASNGQWCFATDTKVMYQVIDTLLVPAGSGGGGTTLTWNDSGNAPITEYVDGFKFESFDNVSSQELYAVLSVPSSYRVGKPIKLVNGKLFCASITGKVFFKTTTALINSSTVLGTYSNTFTSTNAEITVPGVSNTIASVGDIQLTGTTGLINAVAVQPGDKLRIRLYRDNASESSSAALDARLIIDSFEPTFS